MQSIRSPSFRNGPRLRWDHTARKIHRGRVQAEKSEYIQSSLSNSSVLRKLQTSLPDSSGTLKQLPDDFEDEIIMEELDPSGFDEGWIIEDFTESIESDLEPGTEDEQLDFQTDPRFKELPHKVIQQLKAHQKRLKTKKTKKHQDESSVQTRTTAIPHRKLRIIGGEFGGRKLLSPQGRFVRPMMERVRSAIFDMLFANSPGVSAFPSGSRWLDLYAGTGAVGLEAISRGCEEAHFIEMDQWVVSAVLRKNIEELDCTDRASIRITKVEDYLNRLIKLPQYGTGAFDFISVCPPYLQVSYPELQRQLAESGVLHDRSIIFMEYPRQLSREIQDEIGNLKKIKDRAYGRTYLAVYGPSREE